MGALPRARTRPAVSKYVRSALGGGGRRAAADGDDAELEAAHLEPLELELEERPRPARILPLEDDQRVAYRAVFRSVPAAASHATTALSHEPRPARPHREEHARLEHTSCIARHVQPSATASRREPRALRMVDQRRRQRQQRRRLRLLEEHRRTPTPRGAAYTS